MSSRATSGIDARAASSALARRGRCTPCGRASRAAAPSSSPHRRFVDDQHPPGRAGQRGGVPLTACAGASAIGSRTRNRLPLPGPRGRLHAAAVAFDDALHDRQADAESAAAGTADLREHLEDAVQVAGLQPDAGVGHRHDDAVVGHVDAHLDPATRRGVARGVANQVGHYLRHAVGIGVDPHRTGGQVDFEGVTGGFDLGTQRFKGIPHDWDQVDACRADLILLLDSRVASSTSSTMRIRCRNCRRTVVIACRFTVPPRSSTSSA